MDAATRETIAIVGHVDGGAFDLFDDEIHMDTICPEKGSISVLVDPATDPVRLVYLLRQMAGRIEGAARRTGHETVGPVLAALRGGA